VARSSFAWTLSRSTDFFLGAPAVTVGAGAPVGPVAAGFAVFVASRAASALKTYVVRCE
jgi:hypothetical protein